MQDTKYIELLNRLQSLIETSMDQHDELISVRIILENLLEHLNNIEEQKHKQMIDTNKI